MPGSTPDLQKRLQTIETLLGKVETAGDPALAGDVRELIQVITDLYGAGLDRTLELIRAEGEAGATIISKLGRDELVASLLVLYGLHPVSLEERVAQALETVRKRLRSHDGHVEIVSLEDGALRLRLHRQNGRATGHGCGSTAQALRTMVEDAVYAMAPDVTALTIEDAQESQQSFVPVELLQGAAAAAEKGRP